MMRRCVFAKGMNSPLHQTSNRAETLTRLGRSFIFRAIHLRPPRASAIPAMKQRIRRTLGAVLLFGVGFVSRPYIERLVYESPLHPQKATGEYVLMVPPGRVHFMLLQNGSAYELTEGPFIFYPARMQGLWHMAESNICIVTITRGDQQPHTFYLRTDDNRLDVRIFGSLEEARAP
jgi:hypothetical protein